MHKFFLVLALVACGGAPELPAPAPDCFTRFDDCMNATVSYDDALVCRQEREACMGRAGDTQDACLGHAALCLQARDEEGPRRACLSAENECLRTDGGVL